MSQPRNHGKFKIEWVDGHREPTCTPNPDFPAGRDVDASWGADRTCITALPCPARRCGHYVIECEICHLRAAITTAGRPDDPRSLTMACKVPALVEAAK